YCFSSSLPPPPSSPLFPYTTLFRSPGVGKTSLTRRFVSDTFEERYISTLGTKISSKEFAVDDPGRPGSSVTVGAAIWDIMGNHQDRKSTRLNSSHLVISYAVFCLKK